MNDLLMSTLACTSCFGSASDGETAGMKWAILLLAGLAILLQVGVARLLYRIVTRDQQSTAPGTGLSQEAFE